MGTVRKLVLVLVVGVAALSFAGVASADPVPTFPDACGSANNLDYAVCERLDYIAQEQSNIDAELAGTQDQLTLIWGGVWFVGGVTFGTWLFSRLGRELKGWGGGT